MHTLKLLQLQLTAEWKKEWKCFLQFLKLAKLEILLSESLIISAGHKHGHKQAISAQSRLIFIAYYILEMILIIFSHILLS